MAVRKETVKKQFTEALPALLEPGEHEVAAAYTVSGPSPWLSAGIGILIMLLLGMRYYYMVVTDRRVVFMKSSLLTARPKGLAFADPRSGVGISDVNVASVWSKLQYRRPDGKSIRLNFHRWWRDEMQGVVQALGGTVPPAPPA